MGGRRVTTLEGWADCRRCQRHRTRLGVLAPRWPASVKLVVIGVAASRAAQVAQTADPRLGHIVDVLRAHLRLDATQCVADTLVACGLGPPSADEAAACSRRLADQPTGVEPLLVLVGPPAHAVAHAAGLLADGRLGPIGGRFVPFVLADDRELTRLVSTVSLLLDLRPELPFEPQRAGLAGQADRLYRALGKHEGHGQRWPDREWTRDTRRPLTRQLVARHLKGELWVAPFRARGGWPYVVLDVDRHNAAQLARFDNTLKALRHRFPHSFIVRSSDTGGMHMYVRLPPDTAYHHAATWLRTNLTAAGLRWHSFEAADGRQLQVQLVEVPAHPPRLPFGLGSAIPGCADPLRRQLSSFLAWLKRADTTDYERAATRGRRAVGLGTRWTPGSRLKLELFFGAAELGGLPPVPQLAPTDPWHPLVTDGRLLPHLAYVAAQGVPSLGTRTRWTIELIDALVDIVPRPEVERLVVHWLYHRDHSSEDIEVDVDAVERQTRQLIDQRYKALHGLPVRAWQTIEEQVRAALRSLTRPPDPLVRSMRRSLPPHTRVQRPGRLRLDELLPTAFFIARRYFELGQRVRPVPVEELERYAGARTGGDVEKLFAWHTDWIEYKGAATPGEEARRYGLTAKVWPAVPGEPVLYHCPVPVPARRR